MSDERDLSTRELIFWWCAALLGSAALLVLVGLLLVGCANVGALQGGTIDLSKPQQPLPQMLVPVHDAAGNLPTHLVGTLTPWDGSPAVAGINTAQGVVFLTRSTGGATLTFTADGCATYEQPITIEATVPGIVLRPAFVPLPALGVSGQFFAAGGHPWTAIEASDFNLFGRFLNGDDLAPVLAQRQAIGFNLLRVWTRYDIPGIGTLTLAQHPDLYDRLPAFVQLCARYGLYVEFTAYTGHEDFAADHWARLGAAALASDPRPLLELVNEADQAGNMIAGQSIGDMPFQPIAGLLVSHGSNGSQAQPVQPFWNYAAFHTNGAPEEARKVGHNAWEIWNGPTLTNETSRFPDAGGMWAEGPGEREAFDAEAGAALLAAGACFHSVHGKTSELFDDGEVAAARAWVAGARSVPLACQSGGYVHRADLEMPDMLRVYQRGDDPACVVRIRK